MKKDSTKSHNSQITIETQKEREKEVEQNRMHVWRVQRDKEGTGDQIQNPGRVATVLKLQKRKEQAGMETN